MHRYIIALVRKDIFNKKPCFLSKAQTGIFIFNIFWYIIKAEEMRFETTRLLAGFFYW